MMTRKKTTGFLLIACLLAVGVASAYPAGGDAFEDLRTLFDNMQEDIDNIDFETDFDAINDELEDHEDRITALEGTEGPLEKPIRIGMTSANTDGSWDGFENTKHLAAIATADINQYVEGLELDMTFEFVVKNNDHGSALWNTMLFKVTGIDLIIGHGWSGQCLESLNYANTNNMLLISGSSTSPDLAIPNDRLFRVIPHSDELVVPLAEMWKTWGIEYVLTMQFDWYGFPSDDFESELVDRGIESLGTIRYSGEDDDEDPYGLEEANDIITETIGNYGADRVGIQFFSWDEIVELQKQAAEYQSLIDVIWMTSEEAPRSTSMLDEAGEWATQTRHFNPLMTIDEDSILYQEFKGKYKARTGEMPGYYSIMHYDACWLLVETIIETDSVNAGVIADSLIPISADFNGLSGCLALDENGDRLPQLYDIKGFYKDPDTQNYEEGTFGSYDGRTNIVNWDDDFLEYMGITRPGKEE